MNNKSVYFLSMFLGAAFGNLAGLYNSLFLTYLVIPFSPFEEPVDLSLTILVTIIAPIAEEAVKLIPVMFLLSQEKIFLSLKGWIIMGGLAALGFSVFENFIYFLLFMNTYSFLVSLVLLLSRFMLSTPMHLSTTIIASYGVGMWHSYGFKKYLSAIPTAIILHSLYNGFIVRPII